MKATWTAGLLLGVFLLIANNPRRSTPQVSYRYLLAMLPLILATTILSAATLGALGHAGQLARFSQDFQEMLAHDEFRPRRFMLVYGLHLGGYLGGLLGTHIAITLVLRRRRTLAAPQT